MRELTPQCTWIDCQASGFYEQKAKDGRVWATLCETHDKLVHAAYESGDVKRILSNWVKAQGGAKAAVSRM